MERMKIESSTKIRNINKSYKPRNRNIKARDGSVLTDEKGILNRWNKYFRGEQSTQLFEQSTQLFEQRTQLFEQSTQPFEFYENESYDYIDEETEEPSLYKIQEILRGRKLQELVTLMLKSCKLQVHK